VSPYFREPQQAVLDLNGPGGTSRGAARPSRGAAAAPSLRAGLVTTFYTYLEPTPSSRWFRAPDLVQRFMDVGAERALHPSVNLEGSRVDAVYGLLPKRHLSSVRY
jgi:hypothetical protein